MQMEALVLKTKAGYTAFSQAGEGEGGEGVWKDEKGRGGSERRKRVCTPTCHAQEVPQEVEGRGTVGKRK